MPGIRGLQVDASKYTGEINIWADRPNVHVLLCADTLFLDRAMDAPGARSQLCRMFRR